MILERERRRWIENDVNKFHRHVPQFSIAFYEKSKAASKEGTSCWVPVLFWRTTLSEIKFADVTPCTAKPWAEHWPQLILLRSECCKKLLVVQQCMESPGQLLVCNLILDSMWYSWNIIWEARHSRANCSSIGRLSEPSAAPCSYKKDLTLQNKECCATTHQTQMLIQFLVS